MSCSSCNDNIVVVSGCDDSVPEKISSDSVLVNTSLFCIDTNQCDPLTLTLQKTNELLCPSAIMNALITASMTNTTIHSILCNFINSCITTTTTTTTVKCSTYELYGGPTGTTVFSYIECGKSQITTYPLGTQLYDNVCAENSYGIHILSGDGSYTQTTECFTTTTTTTLPCFVTCYTYSIYNPTAFVAGITGNDCTGNPLSGVNVNPGDTLLICTCTPPQSEIFGVIITPLYGGCPTTTTTTTVAPQQFVIQANGVTSVGQSEAWLVTSTCPFSISWGNGVTSSYNAGVNINVSHVYSSVYTGNIIFNSYNLAGITVISFGDATPHSTTSPLYNPITINTSQLHKLIGLKILHASSIDIFISGIAAQLPRSLEVIEIENTNLSGSTYDLPQNSGGYLGLTSITIGGTNIIGGPTLGLPRNLTFINIRGNNFISGTTSDLPRLLTYLEVRGANTISGYTGDILDTPTIGIPRSVENLTITGLNTITGDIAFLPHVLYTCTITGANTVYGNISNLSLSLQLIDIQGLNTVSGNIQSLGLITSLGIFYITGANTLIGDTQYLPSTIVTFYISGIGAFNITGNITTNPLPSGIEIFVVSGSIGISNIQGSLTDIQTLPITNFVLGLNNAISGNLASLALIPTLQEFELSTSATSLITGNLSSLSLLTSLQKFNVSCNNSITGNVSSITGLTALNEFTLIGQNSITGNIGLLPPNIHALIIGGPNHTLNTYSIPISWTNIMNRFSITGGTTVLSITTITNLINDLGLTGVVWGASNGISPYITLRGPAFSSGTSYANLIAQGVTITYV